MADTVKLPAVGAVPKKELAIGGVVVGGLIVVYYARRGSSGSSTTSAPSSSDQYPPDGTTGNPSDPYSTDPATGQTYGDEAAGAGGYGAFGTGAYPGSSGDAYPWDGTYGNPSDPYSMDTATGLTYGDEGQTGVSQPGTGGPPFSSNEQWVSYVLQQQATLNPAADIGAWETALGLYLEGQPVDPAQKTIVFDAIAIGGNPPVAGPSGYPPKVKTNGSKGPGGSVGQVAVPKVTGEAAGTAEQQIDAAGLKARFDPSRQPGRQYTVTSQSPAAGRKADTGSAVTLHLKEDTSSARPPAGRGGK